MRTAEQPQSIFAQASKLVGDAVATVAEVTVKGAVDQVSTLAGNVSETAGAVNSAVTSVRQAAGTVKTAADGVNDIAGAVKNVASTIQDVADTAHTVKKAASALIEGPTVKASILPAATRSSEPNALAMGAAMLDPTGLVFGFLMANR